MLQVSTAKVKIRTRPKETTAERSARRSRSKLRSKREAADLLTKDRLRTLARIEGLFSLAWSTELIAEAIGLSRQQVVDLIQGKAGETEGGAS